MKKNYLVFLLLVGIVNSIVAQTSIIPMGSSWKYLDNGTDQGTAWRSSTFVDDTWASGNGELGYGDGGEVTLVSYGPSATAKYITTYFRKTFNIADASLFASYDLNVRRDDGFVVYVNGIEVARDNLPATDIGYTTAATAAVEDAIILKTLPAGAFVTGSNTIAVEIHQSSGTSSDISYDLSLVGYLVGAAPIISRGPYLQKQTSAGITFRWRTDIATDSKITYGTVLGSYTQNAVVAGTRTEHTVAVTGLLPNTKYFYTVGNAAGVLQGDANNYFRTAPVIGTEQEMNFWVLGDCGTFDYNGLPVQKTIRDAFINYTTANNKKLDGILLLGDNAYYTGSETNYQNGFFNIYKDSGFKNTTIWPATGNHDYANLATNMPLRNLPYYVAFDPPIAAEVGGVASGTEAFYSYNIGNVHFISLDSYGTEAGLKMYQTGSPQATWLQNDLNANTQKWTVVYWHHPPYTMGSHNSDTESDLVAVRTNFISMLEAKGVDLIMCGHSHIYERSKLMKGHYGLEATFNEATHNLSSSSAKYDGTTDSCPYLKKSTETANGTVYVVSGSGGWTPSNQTSYPHSALPYGDKVTGGSCLLSVNENRLDLKYIAQDGVVKDNFTMLKDANQTQNFTINSGDTVILKASWLGNYIWSNGTETTRSISVSPTSSTTITVSDNNGCVLDTFVINISTLGVNLLSKNTYKITPNPFESSLRFDMPKNTTFVLYDVLGKVILKGKAEGILDTNILKKGVYFVKLQNEGKLRIEKIIKK